MPEFIPLISEFEINKQIQKTGQEITSDYKKKIWFESVVSG